MTENPDDSPNLVREIQDDSPILEREIPDDSPIPVREIPDNSPILAREIQDGSRPSHTINIKLATLVDTMPNTLHSRVSVGMSTALTNVTVDHTVSW